MSQTVTAVASPAALILDGPAAVATLDADGSALTVTSPEGADLGSSRPSYVMVRIDGIPRAVRVVPPGFLQDAVCVAELVDTVRSTTAEAAAVDQRLRSRLYAGIACPPGSVTVCVPTAGRPAQLERCLRSLLRQTWSDFELLVVDNSSDDTATRAVVDGLGDPRVQCVFEPAPGSSVARNAAIARANGAIMAFTDDDVVVDPHWLERILDVFARDEHVACVTGLVLPLELDTPAQVQFEQYGGFGKGFVLTVHASARRDDDRLYPFAPGTFGSGNSMAFRTEVLRAMRGFDTRLGAGSKSLAGADIESFLRVVLSGQTLVYEPRAVLWHQHRREADALRRQVFNYGSGLGAIATKLLVTPGTRLSLLSRLPAALWFLLSRRSPKNAKRPANYPAELVRDELRGIVQGPMAFLRARRADAELPHPLGTPPTLWSSFVSHLREPMFRSAYALIVNSAVTASLGLVYWAIAARNYPTQEVGRGSAAVLTLVTLANIGQLNLGGAIARFLPVPTTDRRRFVLRAYGAASAAGASLMAIALVLLPALNRRLDFLPQGVYSRIGLCVAAGAWCVFTLQDYLLTALGRPAWVPIENGVYGIAKIGLLVLLARTFPRHGILLSWVLPAVVIVIAMNLIAIPRLLRQNPATESARSMPHGLLRFVGGDYLGGLFGYLPVLVVPVIVVALKGPEANAAFATALLLASTLDYAVLSYGTALTVAGSADEARLHALTRRLLRRAALLVVPGTLAVAAGAPLLLSLFGRHYADAGTTPLRLLLLGSLAKALVAVYVSACRVRRRMSEIVRIQALGAVASLTAGVLLLQSHGLSGLAFGLSAGWVLTAAVAAVRMRT